MASGKVIGDFSAQKSQEAERACNDLATGATSNSDITRATIMFIKAFAMQIRFNFRTFWFSCLFLAALSAQSAAQSANAQDYDVVVAGAGTGGIAAAIEAGRLGERVALLEETDWIGGQMSAAAVSTMDEGNNLTPPSGLYREFLVRMNAYYTARGKSVGTCYWHNTTHCYEPSAIRTVLNQMIAETNQVGAVGNGGHIDLILQDRVVRVLTDGNAVTGVVTLKGRTLHSKVLIDATEYGDVLPLTPARYRSGRSIGPDTAKTCTQDLTYVMVIKKYPHGVPHGLWMKNPPPEYDKWLPVLRTQWQIDGNPNTRNLPVNFAIHNAYRGLPDSSNAENYVSTQNQQITRTDLNWFNDYPTSTDIFDRGARKKILCEAKLKTLANLYYLQHELKETQWSVANDEGFDSAFNRMQNSCPNIPVEFKTIEANMPPAPYIRESNRLVGEYTLTGADIRREKQGGISIFGFGDSIAVGDYADDLHGCNGAGDFDPVIESLANRPPGFRSGPFEVPLRSLIPEKVDGLLAAEKNISESRLANGATRLQPITMLTGQAAGTLAALAIKGGVQLRAVHPELVQMTLLQAGCILAREPMPDLPMGTRPWQAAQFVVTHGWMETTETGFEPETTLNRAQVAEILTAAFALNGSLPLRIESNQAEKILQLSRKQTMLQASYKDVPLYDDDFVAVGAWHAAGLVPACQQSATLFCPKAPITVGEFLDAVKALAARHPAEYRSDRAGLLRDVPAKQDDLLTRVSAALILYNLLQ